MLGLLLGFPDGTSGKETACQCRTCKRCRLIPGSGRSLGEGLGKPTSVFLPGESHGQRSLAGCSPSGHKESDTTEATYHAHACRLTSTKNKLEVELQFSTLNVI